MNQDILRHAVDLILLGVVVEAVGITTWLARSGRGQLVLPVLLFLGSGLCLIAAARAGLTGGPAALTASFLLFSGIQHAGTLVLLVRRFGKDPHFRDTS